MSRRNLARLCALATATVTCIPNLGPSDSLIQSPRILAVRADPAEANPGATVAFSAFVVGPSGTATTPLVRFSFCTAPKLLTEDNVVSSACLSPAALLPLGTGAGVTAALPANACSLFGPDVASATSRPRDPDATGGYYQPLRADLADAPIAFDLVRIHCDLPGASADAATAFAAAYRINQNPQFLPLAATLGGTPLSFGAVPAGARIVLQASWPAASAETYALFDASSQAITMQREAMEVAWYSSGGALDVESTGRAADDLATTSTNGWQAPSGGGTVHLWVVLRDSRGGVDFLTQDVTVVAE